MVTVLDHIAPMHVLPLCSSPMRLDEDDDTHISCTPGFWRSPKRIETWAADVQEAVSLPPLVSIPASQCLCVRRRQSHQRNCFFKISSPIPWDTFDIIRCQLAGAIDNRNPVALLKRLPDPEILPLVSNKIILTRVFITDIRYFRL